jgi:hypothetical protein
VDSGVAVPVPQQFLALALDDRHRGATGARVVQGARRPAVPVLLPAAVLQVAAAAGRRSRSAGRCTRLDALRERCAVGISALARRSAAGEVELRHDYGTPAAVGWEIVAVEKVRALVNAAFISVSRSTVAHRLARDLPAASATS